MIWCPKYRRRVLGGRVEARLKQLIGQAVIECGGQVIELETMPDHGHLLLEVAPTVPLSALMQQLTGRASGQLRAEFPQLRQLPVVVCVHRGRGAAGGRARLRREPEAGR